MNSAPIFKVSIKLRDGSLSGVYITIMNKDIPTKLKIVWNIAVCLEALELPIAAIHDVIQVPMFAPTTKHNALGNGNNEPEIKNTTIDVTTDDD